MISRYLSASNEGEIEVPNVVLFPFFSILVGIFVYYIISRYAHGVPYTATMFLIGSTMGYASLHTNGNNIVESIKMWLGINGEVIILSFLPGLIFLDSYNINVYLFRKALSQLLIFAFPMVLSGTFLTALVAFYILPYGWSMDLCLTLGSILAATDPVAVAVLLNELGAPSRLKVHIAGESLLNDGSAVVFYQIFSLRFLYEMGIPGVGEDIGWLRGFILFFRLSLGGACIGLLFGIGLVALLFNLNRRLSQEENTIQVTATITIAYLSFFVSEIICHCSGIISVVVCGLTTKLFGETLLNDSHLTHDFWHITEHLLNSVLFTLGGAVWGGVISSTEVNEHYFGGTDWMYLFMLFGLVTVIRFVLVFAFYPLTSNLGVGQSLKEAIFMSYGGLRGAVGIALALLLSAEVSKYSESDTMSLETRSQYREFAEKLFGFVGGVAFLTLVINGPTSGPLLKRLGLVTPTETRKNVVLHYVEHMKQNVLVAYLSLLEEKRFQYVDFAIVREFVSPLKQITDEDLAAACVRYQLKNGKTPNTTNIKQYMNAGVEGSQSASFRVLASTVSSASQLLRAGRSSDPVTTRGRQRETVYDFSKSLDENVMLEERSIFIDLLRREYHRQLASGELDSRGFIPHTLLRSLDIADEGAAKGLPLDDWAGTQAASGGMIIKKGEQALHSYRVQQSLFSRQEGDQDFHFIRTRVLQALSFIQAHQSAQETFKIEFASVNQNSLTLAEKTVIDESRDQVAKADSAINAFDEEDVKAVKSQYVCQILLHKAATYFEKLASNGLMTEREANEFLERYDLELRKLRISSELKTEVRQMGSRGKIAPESGLGRLDEE